MLRTWWLDQSIYWTYVVVLIATLVAREFLGSIQDDGTEHNKQRMKWQRAINYLSLSLLAIFIIYVVAQVITIVSRLLS